MLGVFVFISILCLIGGLYVYKQMEMNEEEFDDGYYAAMQRYRYMHSIMRFPNPQTSFEKGWNSGIEAIIDVTGKAKLS